MYLRNVLLNVLLAIGALTLVAGASIVVFRISHGANVEQAEAALERPAILVATHSLESGALLRPEDMAWREVGDNAIAAGNLVRGKATMAEYSGAVVRRHFAAGEAFIASAIVKPSERGFLAAVLSPGDRAMTISVGASQTASGLVLPGDYVDVLLTQNFDSYTTDPARKSVSETVLYKVRIIAVDRKMTGADESAPSVKFGVVDPARVPKTVTLEVDEQQAQRLMVAASLGHIDLALRALQSSAATQAQISAPASPPVWASDVSPALGELTHRTPVTHAGHAVEQAAPVRVMRGSKTETQ